MTKNDFFCNFELKKSKDDKYTLVINGKYIHSLYSPEKEAENLTYDGKNLIAVFGLGFAYHINNIIRNNPDSIFIVYEPYKEIFSLSKDIINIESLSSNKGILLLNENNFEKIFDFLEKNNPISEYRLVTYSNQGYKNLLPDVEREFHENVKKCYEISIQNILTESNFIPLWTKNFLYNSSLLYRIPILNQSSKDMGENLAVICCAGPNLLNDVELIKKFRDKLTLFAVDTALKSLLSCNINPDFIVSLDSQAHTIHDFSSKIPNESSIILDIIGYSKVTGLSENVFFNLNKSVFTNTIADYFFNIFKIEMYNFMSNTGGTVSDYSLSLAMQFGFKNIYMSGLDLSYPNLQTHSNGSPFYDIAMNNSDYIDSPETILINSVSKKNLKYEASKITGRKVLTDFVLLNYANYFSRFAEKYRSLKIYNSKYHGLQIENLIEIDLFELLNSLDSRRFYFHELIDRDNTTKFNKAELYSFFNNLQRAIYSNAKPLKEFLEKETSLPNDKNAGSNYKKFSDLYESIIAEFPFLKKFIIMTDIILKKKNIESVSKEWYIHIFHRILQSMYFIIKVCDKIKKSI